MEALDEIGTILEQLQSILERLNKLDINKNSVKSIEANIANLKTWTAKLERFEITAAKDKKDVKESYFNGDALIVTAAKNPWIRWMNTTQESTRCLQAKVSNAIK